MKDWQSQAHVKWECKYHIIIIPKYRKKKHFKKHRKAISQIIRELCRQKDVGLLEGNAASDHLHMLLSVPPKYSITMTIGYLKGKSAIRIHRVLFRTKGTLFGRSFWSRGYCVSTVGRFRQYRQIFRHNIRYPDDDRTGGRANILWLDGHVTALEETTGDDVPLR